MLKNFCIHSERLRSFRAPDLPACRAMRVGKGADMVYCLRRDASDCGYALRFGSGFFCYHPRQNEIVTRTKSEMTVVS